MFLQNWESIQTVKLTGGVESSNPSVFGGSSKALKGYNGAVAAGSMNWFGNENITSSTYYSSALLSGLKLAGGWMNVSGASALAAMAVSAGMGPVLAVGSGSGAVSDTDYALTDITTLTHVSYSYGACWRTAAGWWCGWVGRTFTNNTGSPVTVSELGIYLPLYCGNTSSTVAMVALVYRELLKTPVTVAAGESYTFGVKLKFYGKR